MSRLSDRDCGCAHHWNCKGLAPSGVKPVLRPAQTAVADAAVQAELEGQEAVAVIVSFPQIPSGKRVALYSRHQMLPIGTKLYAHQPAAPAIPQDVEKDAERYRWLRANWTTMRSSATDTTLKLTTGEEPWADFGPDVIDAAIDLAALAAAPQPCSPNQQHANTSGSHVSETANMEHVAHRVRRAGCEQIPAISSQGD